MLALQNKLAYLHGNSLNLVTPIDETRTTLFTDRGIADMRFLTPSQSTIIRPQSESAEKHRLN